MCHVSFLISLGCHCLFPSPWSPRDVMDPLDDLQVWFGAFLKCGILIVESMGIPWLRTGIPWNTMEYNIFFGLIMGIDGNMGGSSSSAERHPKAIRNGIGSIYGAGSDHSFIHLNDKDTCASGPNCNACPKVEFLFQELSCIRRPLFQETSKCWGWTWWKNQPSSAIINHHSDWQIWKASICQDSPH